MTHRTMSERSYHGATSRSSRREARCSSVIEILLSGAVVLSDRSLIEQFLTHLLLHNWCNKGHGSYYPVCGMMHIEDGAVGHLD